MGFTAVPAPAHIITVDMTVAGTPVNFDRDFWQTFRTIASNPVGRVLLYRILIEIRRQNAGFGAIESNMLAHDPNMQQRRNNRRRIYIQHNNNAYNTTQGCIKFILDDAKELNTVSARNEHGAIEIIRYARTSDIGLFHEMLHWFHSLRDYVRYSADRDIMHENQHFATIIDNPLLGYQINIANHYYSALNPVAANPNQRENSAIAWHSNRIVNYEEMRTILGVPNTLAHFRNGDDLSENLYRLFTPARNMRFSHIGRGYFEDEQVINTSRQSAINNEMNHNVNAFVLPAGTAANLNALPRQGLGNFRIN